MGDDKDKAGSFVPGVTSTNVRDPVFDSRVLRSHTSDQSLVLAARRSQGPYDLTAPHPGDGPPPLPPSSPPPADKIGRAHV